MQQVNLYLPELRPQREWLSAISTALIVIGFIVIMAGAYVLKRHQLQVFSNSVEVLAQQQDAARSRVGALRQRAVGNKSPQLDEKITELKAILHARTRVSELIVGQSLGNEQGYSPRLYSLARRADENVSLQQIRFSRGASYTEFDGAVRAPEYTTRFIQSLEKEESFNGTKFGALSIAPNGVPGDFRFTMGFEHLFDVESDFSESKK